MQRQTLKVLSYNVYPGTIINDMLIKERTKRQISIIKYYMPDIVCLQEVYDNSQYIAAFESEYHMVYFGNVRNKLSYCVDYILYIVCVLLAMTVMSIYTNWHIINYIICHIISIYILHRLPVITWLRSDTNGLLTMIKHNVVIVDSKYIVYECQSSDIMNNINARAYIKIDININGYPMTVINTHLNALGDSNHRMLQLKQLATDVDTGVYIICGDFNCDTNSDNVLNFKQLTSTTYTTEGTELHTWDNSNTLTNSWLPSANATYDYIFYKNIILLHKQLLLNDKPYCSDHFGTYAILRN